MGENIGEGAEREEKARHALGTESIKYPEKILRNPKTSPYNFSGRGGGILFVEVRTN